MKINASELRQKEMSLSQIQARGANHYCHHNCHTKQSKCG